MTEKPELAAPIVEFIEFPSADNTRHWYISMPPVSIYWNALKPSIGSLCLLPSSLRMRVQKMPVREDAVLNDLQTAIMYWHGRDRACRPILVWRMEKVYALGAFPASAAASPVSSI